MDTLISQSPAETQSIGRAWGEIVTEGTVFALTGDLGAGKTQLVKGLAAGLGFTGRVSSPTFALVNEYHGGRLPLFHLDLYRLESAGEVAGAGLEDYLIQPAGVTVVEWAERWFGPMTDQPLPGVRRVLIETLGETERRIQHVDSGD
ncbi:MAG: tRNA (adenosine(37)-N6)-threonylcarbamoyltransferase complex ATPase subunit type 1 TsaE [Verrucomicrobiae bacterium]|nr:tRNA (adenosine(37)-N6)-threonylcarbamoyltransferase complex ATPase subunit type 1 TsaE [Verrucomicrobiae bacterium]MCP5522952.1 tRNA (adenosine(37)-N6)-threonylcarbamoyltransferase complex ATPase subunit type 1 TsaE [Verrucomicrobiales bacterium]